MSIQLQCNYDTITIQVQYQHNVSQAWETESAAWRAGTGLYEYVTTEYDIRPGAKNVISCVGAENVTVEQDTQPGAKNVISWVGAKNVTSADNISE